MFDEMGSNKQKPWLKTDKQSVLNNIRAEESVLSRELTSRKAMISIGNFTVNTGPNNMSDPKCGQTITTGIVNGANAPNGAYPWVVVILRYGRPHCAGSIINENWILTAAHCFEQTSWSFNYIIRVGSNDRTKGADYKVSKIIMHNRYNANNCWDSDIGLMKTETAIKMSRLVRPVCLPSNTFDEPESQYVMAVGWGELHFGTRDSPIFLQEVKLTIEDLNKCAKKYQLNKFRIFRSQICTWNKDKDACRGDSGGPAIEYVKGRGTLVGIISYGHKCADEYPGVFTLVSYFMNWISENLKESG